MEPYLVQWSRLSGVHGEQPCTNRELADLLADSKVAEFGGLACVVRVSDGVTVYRVWKIPEEAHAA